MGMEFKLPELGENIESAEVVGILVEEGDEVESGQHLLELETEKAVVELPSPVRGRIARLHVEKGDKIEVGALVATIEESEDGDATEDGDGTEAAGKAEAEAGGEPRGEVRGENGSRRDEPAGRKASERRQAASTEESARPRQPATATLEPPDERKAARTTAPARGDAAAEPPKPAEPEEHRTIPAGPATRRLARELGVDLSQVRGTGSGDRITEEDVREFVRQRLQSGAQGIPAAASLPDFSRWGPIRREPLLGIRRKTAESMAVAWSTIPHVTQFDVADVTDLEGLRRSYQANRAAERPKLTMTAFLVKAAAKVLRELPQFNTSLDIAGGEIIYKEYCHIGVAVDTENGLLVPVIRDSDKKSVDEIAAELAALAEKARNRKLSLEEMQGGTFTISNLGSIGGTAFTPIVYHPQVAILGVSRGRHEQVVSNGMTEPRLLLPLSLSYDHRVIDGADGTRFTRRLAEVLSTPVLLM